MRMTRIAVVGLAAVIAVGGATIAYAATEQPAGPNPAKADALIRHCTDLYNQRAWTDLEANCYDTGRFVDHTPESGQEPTWAGFKHMTDVEDVAFPDWKTTILELTAQGDRVVMHFRGTGTQTGSLEGLPATRKPVAVTGMRMFRIQHGRITDTWVNYDELGLLQQLGVVPKLGPAPVVDGVQDVAAHVCFCLRPAERDASTTVGTNDHLGWSDLAKLAALTGWSLHAPGTASEGSDGGNSGQTENCNTAQLATGLPLACVSWSSSEGS